MTVEQVRCFYEGKKNYPCPLTEELIKAGYQQKRGGYIHFAYTTGQIVDYTQAEPNQWWHLIESWCNRSKPNHKFSRRIRCGELYFWMAEVSGEFSNYELNRIKDKALSIAKSNTPDNKLPWRTVESNDYIRSICYDRIVKRVEEYCNKENDNLAK